MDERAIKEVLRDVFGAGMKTKTINGWVSIRCPLARWRHQKRNDANASAGVKINDSGTSVFNCYACHSKFPFHRLIQVYGEYTGEDFDDLVEELESEAYLGSRTLPTWDETRQTDEENILTPLKDSVYMDLYDSAAGHPYLRKRGISDETARRLQLLYDPEDPADGFPRILFPIRGPDGELYGFSGRDVTGKAKLKVRDYQGLNKRLCVLGAHLVNNKDVDKVILVEGLFDYANAWECGQPAVAVMHSTLTPAQATILREIGKPTYLFYDNPDIDAAGADGVEIAGRQLTGYVPTMRVRYPKIWIEDPEEREGGHWLKDPGDMMPEDFERMISDARLFHPRSRHADNQKRQRTD